MRPSHLRFHPRATCFPLCTSWVQSALLWVDERARFLPEDLSSLESGSAPPKSRTPASDCPPSSARRRSIFSDAVSSHGLESVTGVMLPLGLREPGGREVPPPDRGRAVFSADVVPFIRCELAIVEVRVERGEARRGQDRSRFALRYVSESERSPRRRSRVRRSWPATGSRSSSTKDLVDGDGTRKKHRAA